MTNKQDSMNSDLLADALDIAAEHDKLKAVNAELLEALKEVVRTLESDAVSICDTIWVSNGSPETLYDHCRAAIAKAEGL